MTMKFQTSIIVAALALAFTHGVSAQSPVDSLLLPSPPTLGQNSAVPGVVMPAPAGQIPVAPAQMPVQDPQVLRDQQFQQALQAAVPMSADQITQYRLEVEAANQARVTPLQNGVPVSRSIRLNLSPGEASPILRVQPGVVSTMTFSDITGQPWPVMSVVTGNPGAYVAQSAGAPGQSNIIVISAVQAYVPSNLVVTLLDHAVPVTISLLQGQPEVDYRVDLQVSSRGPNAQNDMALSVGLAPTNDSNMLAFLDGTPPEGARRLSTTSSDVEAWGYGQMVYVRTRGDLMSPAYINKASNVSGVNIFVLKEAPVVIVSAGGQMASVRINR